MHTKPYVLGHTALSSVFHKPVISSAFIFRICVHSSKGITKRGRQCVLARAVGYKQWTLCLAGKKCRERKLRRTLQYRGQSNFLSGRWI